MARMTCLTLRVAGAALLLFSTACDPAVDGDDGGSTTDSTTGDGPGTSTGSDPSTSSTSVATTDASTTLEPGTSSTTTEEGSSSSTGEPVDCVDEDIGAAVGEAVVTATNDGQGDDFSLRFCDGGVGSTTGGADSGGGDEATTDPTGMTTGMTSGVTSDGETGEVGDGDDYVVAWTPPSSGPYTLDTFGSGIDTVLSVVPPVCGAPPEECNDDCVGLESGLVYEASKGQTVYIVIEGYSGRQGEFVLNIADGGALDCGVGTTSDSDSATTGMTTGMTTSP